MTTLKIALDWTPNINHIGFFVAKDKGFYQESGLNVEIIDSSLDNYQTTPAKKVELGEADFALCPIESIISYRTKAKPFDLVALAALLREDLSAIVVKKESGIKSPRYLDGKTYGSYKARYEDGIVKEMIKNDGGNGDIEIIYPEKLGIWEMLQNSNQEARADATWIFLNWEGVEAEDADEDFVYFKMSDYDIPYSYSPVLAAQEAKVRENTEAYQSFLEATRKGFLYCQSDPEETTSILEQYIPAKDKKINLKKALEMTAPHFGNEENWGKLERKNVSSFLSWIKDKKLEESNIEFEQIVSLPRQNIYSLIK